MASLSTKQGQPSTYSPGTLASSRRRLGNFLAGIASLGSPLRSIPSDPLPKPSEVLGDEVESPLKAKVYRRGQVDVPREGDGPDGNEFGWPALAGRGILKSDIQGRGGAGSSAGLDSSVVSVVDSAIDISGGTEKRSYFLELPDDLILSIFQSLPLSPSQLCTLSLVSRRPGAISQSPILWSQLYHSTPGFSLSPGIKDRLVAVSDPPEGEWRDGSDWIWDGPLPDINRLSIKSRDSSQDPSPSRSIPVHYPTLYRSRLSFSDNLRHPSPTHRTRTEVISEHSDAVYSIRSSGNWLFTGSRDKSIRIWRIGSFDQYGQPGQTVLVKAIPDAHDGSVLCLSVDIDLEGKGQMISGSSDHTTRLWSINLSDPASPLIKLESTLRGHDLAVLDVALTPEYIISASKDTTVRVWSRSTLELKYVFEDHERAVNAIAVSPDGGSVVSASGSGMWVVRDLENGEIVRKGGGKQGQLGGVACIAWKGNYIVTGSSDRKVTIYNAISTDPKSTDVIKICRGHTDMVRAVDINLEDGWVVSGSYDGSVRLWDLQTGILMRNFSTINASFVFDVHCTLTRLFVARQNNTFDIISLVTGLPYLDLIA